LYISEDPREEDLVEIKDCAANPNHVPLSYYNALEVNLEGGTRLSPFLPTWTSRVVVISHELHARLEVLRIKGARLDPAKIGNSPWDLKDVKQWNFQFLGRIRRRPPKFLDTANQCPKCGRGKIVCESCGYWIPLCEVCGQEMYILETAHKGPDDKRI